MIAAHTECLDEMWMDGLDGNTRLAVDTSDLLLIHSQLVAKDLEADGLACFRVDCGEDIAQLPLRDLLTQMVLIQLCPLDHRRQHVLCLEGRQHVVFDEPRRKVLHVIRHCRRQPPV